MTLYPQASTRTFSQPALCASLLSTDASSNPTARTTRSSIPGLVKKLFFVMVSRLIKLSALVRWIYILTFTTVLSVVAQSSCYPQWSVRIPMQETLGVRFQVWSRSCFLLWFHVLSSYVPWSDGYIY